MYRAQFPQTFKEMKAPSGDYKIVIPVVTAGCLIAVWLADFLRRTGKRLLTCFTINIGAAALVWQHVHNYNIQYIILVIIHV